MVRLLAERSVTKTNAKLGGFDPSFKRFYKQLSYVKHVPWRSTGEILSKFYRFIYLLLQDIEKFDFMLLL